MIARATFAKDEIMKKMLMVVLMAAVCSCGWAEGKKAEVEYSKKEYMAELVGLTQENYRLRKDLKEKKSIIRQLMLRLTRLSYSYQSYKKGKKKKKVRAVRAPAVDNKNKIEHVEWCINRLLSQIAGFQKMNDKIKYSIKNRDKRDFKKHNRTIKYMRGRLGKLNEKLRKLKN